MENKKSFNFFTEMAKKNPDEKSVKINSFNDYSNIDAEFIKKYIKQGARILDLASGSGLIINKLVDHVEQITAVEPFKEFTKYIFPTDKIKIVNKDLQSFESDEEFDAITLFGIVQYFSKKEMNALYHKYYKNLKPNGIIIVKNQFGVKEDVVVSGYSEELKTDYFSEYRYLDNEMELLKSTGFKNVKHFDIYPKEFNRWENTHFYAIVAEKE